MSCNPFLCATDGWRVLIQVYACFMVLFATTVIREEDEELLAAGKSSVTATVKMFTSHEYWPAGVQAELSCTPALLNEQRLKGY
eukprot:362559-Chlamydomonas_euryale.AAC.3